MADGGKGVGTAAPRGLQRAPEGKGKIGNDVSRRDSAASSERAKSDNVGMETFVDRLNESTEKIGNSRVA